MATAGDGEIEEHENEYTHSHQPLEVREPTAHEQEFLRNSMEGNLEGLKISVSQNRCDINCVDLWGNTALMHSCAKKHLHIVKWLMSKGADINKQDYRGITALMESAWNKKPEFVKLLLENGADVNLTDERDYTALMQSAEEGHANIVQILCDAGADLNKQEKKRNYTALMWAVVEGHPPVVQILVNSGADLNKQDKYGFTALMQAARTRFLAAVLMLVGAGADLDIKDKKGRSVYDLGNQQVLQAIEKGKRELRRRYMQVLSGHLSFGQYQSENLTLITSFLVGV